MYWMSSNSSIDTSDAVGGPNYCTQQARMPRPSLHLIEHHGQRCFHLKGLLYLISTHKRILAIFQKTWALMLADEFYECWSVRLPIRREALQVFEHGVDTGFLEKCDRIFGVFVEVRVEYALIHEVGIAADVEEHPSQIVKPERGKNER